MLRDVPIIYIIFLVFGIILLITFVSYTNDFTRGGDTLALNDIALTSAVSRIDQLSRLQKGTLVLEDSFELKAWEELADKYPEGSEVRFDYLYDKDIGNFHGKNVPEKNLSPLYTIGGSQTPRESSAVFKDLPIKAIRVLVRKAGDNATADGTGWTYTSTIKLDVAEDN